MTLDHVVSEKVWANCGHEYASLTVQGRAGTKGGSMSVQIIDVKMGSSGSGHEAISDYLWKDEAGATQWADKRSMVDWVRSNPREAWVAGPTKSAWVEVIDNPGGQDYLRTRADGVLTDNLLSLPGAR
jgi:hypothetical protein